MKNLHGVLHGNKVDGVSWSIGYCVRPTNKGRSDTKLGIVVINEYRHGRDLT